MRLTKPKKAHLPIAVALFILALGAVLYSWFLRSPETGAPPADEFTGTRRAIDGMREGADWEDPIPIAVIMENSHEAWPLSGIAGANLVWEAPTEAGIPRLLAVFGDGGEIDAIGPVRSARPYFTDWAEEFGAVYAHVGGSPEALGRIPRQNVLDLNEFYNGGFFRRNHRPRPHNVYTNTELLNVFLKEKEPYEVSYGSWLWKDDGDEPRTGAQEIEIPISRSTIYNVRWVYDPQRNGYRRFQGERPYADADGRDVFAKNIIVMETDIAILDSIGRRRIRTLGEGRALVLRDGENIEAVWRRPELSARTRFFDAAGEAELVFVAGPTWIEVMEDLGEVKLLAQ